MNIITKNKKAKFNYEFMEQYTAGLVLTGSEVKSIKDNLISLSEAYISIDNNQAYLKQAHISKTVTSNRDHQEVRNIKLLLNRKEIDNLHKSVAQKGLAIVPYIIFVNKGLIKLELYLSKGKKNYDKRQTIKDRDLSRKIEH